MGNITYHVSGNNNKIINYMTKYTLPSKRPNWEEDIMHLVQCEGYGPDDRGFDSQQRQEIFSTKGTNRL